MPNGMLHLADAGDVRAAYLVLLGRNAESPEVVEGRTGLPIAEIVNELARSDEFRQIADDGIRGGVIKHEHLSRKDHVTAVRWLGRIAPDHLDPAIDDWWSLLYAALNAADFHPAETDEFLLSVQARLADRYEANRRRFAEVRAFLQFDEAWYLRSHQKAQLALSSGAVGSAAEYFLRIGLAEGQQLLPVFSEGLDQTYGHFAAGGDWTLGDVLAQTLRDAQSGRLSHWLFSRSFYRDSRQWSHDARTGDTAGLSDAELFLDFLTRGDQAGVPPHPLFNHYAYRVLNDGVASSGDATFRNYVTNGCFAGLRTSALFDDEYYLVSNADARYAVLTGNYVSALHHFLKVGIHRDTPFVPDFDPNFYLDRYPDIREAVTNRTFPSASFHFVHRGATEGRLPNPYFNPAYYRQRHPLVPDEMRRLNIRTELEHFLLIGKARGYKPEQPLVTTLPAMDAAKAIFQRRARRSFSNLKHEPRDFTALAAKPAISLVMPVCNEIEFTARALDCAFFAATYLKHSTGLDCEVIVVDNGSTDGTGLLLEACPGLVVADFDHPIGFPRAVNVGVGRARGEVIIVANNDIEFAPDVLSRVHARLAADAGIGMLGGLTILPNETLQEAGSFLNSGAGVIGLGRYEDPWNQYFQGVHDADYCTGSFIAFRRADYAAVGGFDEAFSPGYYEETDFSFRLLEKLNKRAVIDSAIQITHFEHASFGKGRPPTAAYALIRRNQDRFVDKHREAVRSRPAPLALDGGVGVRPLAIGRTRMLVIEDLMPDPRLGSGFVRSSQLLAALTRFEIAYDLLVLNPSAVVDDYADPRVTVYRNWMPGEDIETILSRRGGGYSHVMVCRTHNLTRYGGRLEQLRHQHGFQLICDTEALSVLRVIEMQRLAGRDTREDAVRDAVRLELSSPARVDHWIAVSPYEREIIADAGLGAPSVICHHFPRPRADTLPPFHERSRVLMVGAIHEPGTPNHDGLLWFLDRIYPRCDEAMSSLTLTLVGYWHPDVRESLMARCRNIRVEFKGVVSDRVLLSLYDQTRVALAPTRFAAGVASKVLEPMMLGVPIVITDLLELQLVGRAGVGSNPIAVGQRDDDGESFAAWVTRLATDPVAWSRVQAAQYRAAEPLASKAEFDRGVQDLIRTTGMRSNLTDAVSARLETRT